VQLPVVNDGMFKKWKRSAIKPAVSHQHERSFLDRRVVGLNRQPGWLTSRDLRRGNQITERPKIFLQLRAGFFHRLSIETDSGELDKELLVRFRQIDRPSAVALNDVPAMAEIVHRKSQLSRAYVHRPNWQKA